jgi:hypothetical protein
MATGSVPDWLISPSRALVILAPRHLGVSERVGSECRGWRQYDTILRRAQRLRGSIYFEDGAITKDELTPDGRHVSPADEISWHVLAVDAGGAVRGCARYLPHDPSVPFSRLMLRNSALACDHDWGWRLRKAVEAEMLVARAMGVAYAEVGGWAIDRSIRCGAEALRIALATYALSRRIGGCVGITTATVRHHSAATLQKIGGSPLEYCGSQLPHYFDPQYQCEMAILRFRSDQANPRFDSWINCLDIQLRTAPVLYWSEGVAQRPRHMDLTPVKGTQKIAAVA